MAAVGVLRTQDGKGNGADRPGVKGVVREFPATGCRTTQALGMFTLPPMVECRWAEGNGGIRRAFLPRGEVKLEDSTKTVGTVMVGELKVTVKVGVWAPEERMEKLNRLVAEPALLRSVVLGSAECPEGVSLHKVENVAMRNDGTTRVAMSSTRAEVTVEAYVNQTGGDTEVLRKVADNVHAWTTGKTTVTLCDGSSWTAMPLQEGNRR
ncbi:MAG: hypothetical protein ABIJ10_03260 [Candidatus Micrarchaeota archaeon]